MAEALSEQELQLKRRARRRLIGAAALALLLVVFLPMLLDREPAPSNHDISITIPPRDGTPFQPKAEPIQIKPAAPLESPGPAPGAATKEDTSSAPPGPLKPEPADAEPANARPAEKPVDKSPEKAARKTTEKTRSKLTEKPAKTGKAEPVPQRGAFVVQIGVFSDPAKASEVQARLADSNVKSYVQTMGKARRSKIHVRMGPYATRAEAEKARAELTLLGETSMIIKQ